MSDAARTMMDTIRSGARLSRELGLKVRDNDEVRQAFAAEVAGLCQAIGLHVPAWKPRWDQLPEEAHIPG